LMLGLAIPDCAMPSKKAPRKPRWT